MSKQLEAIYERGVLRPIEPLALAENQRVRSTLVEKPLSWLSAGPVNERREEMHWLAKESRSYFGAMGCSRRYPPRCTWGQTCHGHCGCQGGRRGTAAFRQCAGRRSTIRRMVENVSARIHNRPFLRQ